MFCLIRSIEEQRSQVQMLLSPLSLSLHQTNRPWSDAEKTAIKQGMKIYGKGEWAKIKEHYKEILGERTSGQISVSISMRRGLGSEYYFLKKECGFN